MTTELLDRDVFAENGEKLGRVTDVLFATDGESARWAVISPGLLASERYVPLVAAYTSTDGRVIVPYDRSIVKHAPKADRDHVITADLEEHLVRYYDIA